MRHSSKQIIRLVFFLVILLLIPQFGNSNGKRLSSEKPFKVVSEQLVGQEGVEEAEEVGLNIRINVAARRLFLYHEDELLKNYQIAVGSPGFRTPLGSRWLSQIVWNPWWIPPPDSEWSKDEEKVPPGRRNPLGPVKMILGNAILIHGTSQPRSIGRAASHGCMRMLSEQAKDLARSIQENVIENLDEAVFEKYKKHSRRSYYVNLDEHIPVEIVYELAEVKDRVLHVYQDVYYRYGGKKKMAAITKVLEERGYDPERINLEFIESQLKISRRADYSFELKKLRVKKKKSKKNNEDKLAMR